MPPSSPSPRSTHEPGAAHGPGAAHEGGADDDSGDTGPEGEWIDLPALPGAAGAARRFTAARLRAWGLDALVEDCELVASELVTNAVRAVAHGRLADDGAPSGVPSPTVPDFGLPAPGAPAADVRLRLRLTPDRLYCEVRDPVDARPVPAAAATFDECGRGLLLVASLAAGWTCRPCPAGGKTVVAWWDLGTAAPE